MNSLKTILMEMSDCAFGQGTQIWTNVALAQTPSCLPPTREKCTKEAR